MALEGAMMGTQGQMVSGSGGMSGQPGGWGQGTGEQARRGPGLVAAVLAFGLLVLMAVGSVRVMRERQGSPIVETFENGRHGKVDAVAIMGGREFDVGSKEFRTADAVAIMGHCVLDLRNAQVQGDRAVIDAVAIMGSVEILVPPDWEVKTGDMISAGAVKVMTGKTVAEDPKQVRIDGAVLMGRLEVRR